MARSESVDELAKQAHRNVATINSLQCEYSTEDSDGFEANATVHYEGDRIRLERELTRVLVGAITADQHVMPCAAVEYVVAIATISRYLPKK